MLTSITPLGERGKRQRWAVTASAYVLGSVLGGTALGASLGGIGAPLTGPLPRPLLLLLGALACAVAAVSDLDRPAWRLPGGHRQVDEDWLTRYRGWVYGVGFGVQLGLGVVTIVTSAATYALLALALLAGGVGPGALLGLVFGLLRALPILTVRRAGTPALLRVAALRLERLSGVAARSVVSVLTACSAVLLAGAVLA